jgi:NAD(P)-dependent dehydrogenase (short-subunit alcohol dehydrogenase family)
MGILEGKVALITGAGRGIGREEALLFATHGASVVVNDLGGEWDGAGADTRPASAVADEIVAAGGKAVADHGSVTDSEAVAGMVRRAVDELGGLDILVNNAGILRDRMVFNLDAEDIMSVLQVHLMGTFNTIRHAASYWREQSKAGNPVAGRIVNTSSASGLFANAGQSNYGAAKAAIAAVTQIASMELSRYHVTVNAVAPTARTRLTIMGSRVITEGKEGDDRNAKWDPLDPANVAPFVTFLVSDAAAGITGQVFGVYGGSVQLYEGWRPGPEIRTDNGPFTVDEISGRWKELFGDRPLEFRSPLEDLRVVLNADLQRAGLSG